MVYAEQAGDAAPPLDAWLALAEAHGARDHDVRVYEGTAAIREARRLRHAIPATVNERQAAHRAAGGRKVSTDWAVPYRALPAFVARTRAICADAGIPTPITFGHAGNGHPHQNFIGRDAAEVSRYEAVVEAILREVVALGGTVAAEHGIGKVKARWVGLQLAAPQRAVLRAIKAALDPAGVFAPGNLFG
jgi:FAD/FMN-containing dehydrogenase